MRGVGISPYILFILTVSNRQGEGQMELIISYLSLGLCPRGVVVDDGGKARMMVLGE